ncbi:10028_t:CDS:2, partial [Dentiscutata heterogama]
MHSYFSRKPSKWILDSFLEECELGTTRAKISLYLKCLEEILKNSMDEQKLKKAQKLLNKYKESFEPRHEAIIGGTGDPQSLLVFKPQFWPHRGHSDPQSST